MNLKTRKYYMNILGMFGEFISLKAQQHAPAAPTTAGDELRLMRHEGLIRYYKHQDGIRTFRISAPGGYEALAEMDSRLFEHAELMTGTQGARYPGSKEYRIKKRRESALMLEMANNGFVVDGAFLSKDREMMLASPSLTDAETIIKSIPEDTPLFLSGMLLKSRRHGNTHSRREMSTSSGTLFSRGGIYTTFSINTAKFRWYSAAELSAANDITRLYEDARDLPRHADGRLRSIIYTETEDVAADLIASTGKGSQRMDPTTIFKLSYIAPLTDKELAMDITKMLTIPDWRLKADEVLGLSPAGKYDGETEDGRRIHNLLCCNLARLHELEGSIRKGNCKLVIHDWMKPIIEGLYETEIDAIALSPKHLKGLLITVGQK